MSFKLDVGKFKKVKSDKDATTMRHSDGHEIRIAHRALSPKMRGDLMAMPNMAEGGSVPPVAPAASLAPVAPAPVAPGAAAPIPSPARSSGNSPTRTNTETGGSSPGGASTGGVGSGLGGAGTGGAATGGASTGGAGTANVTISGNSGTGSNGGGSDKKMPITLSNIGGKTSAGNVASGSGPGALGHGGHGGGTGGGGGGAAPSEPSNYANGGQIGQPDSSGSGNSPTRTNTETGGSSPGGASTGGVGSGIGGAGTGGAATGGASTGGAGTVNVTVSGNSGTGSNEGKSSSGSGKGSKGGGKPININISNVGGKTDAGNTTSGDGPGASGSGGSGKGSGGGGGGAAPSEPSKFSDDESDDEDVHSYANGGSVSRPTEKQPQSITIHHNHYYSAAAPSKSNPKLEQSKVRLSDGGSPSEFEQTSYTDKEDEPKKKMSIDELSEQRRTHSKQMKEQESTEDTVGRQAMRQNFANGGATPKPSPSATNPEQPFTPASASDAYYRLTHNGEDPPQNKAEGGYIKDKETYMTGITPETVEKSIAKGEGWGSRPKSERPYPYNLAKGGQIRQYYPDGGTVEDSSQQNIPLDLNQAMPVQNAQQPSVQNVPQQQTPPVQGGVPLNLNQAQQGFPPAQDESGAPNQQVQELMQQSSAQTPQQQPTSNNQGLSGLVNQNAQGMNKAFDLEEQGIKAVGAGKAKIAEAEVTIHQEAAKTHQELIDNFNNNTKGMVANMNTIADEMKNGHISAEHYWDNNSKLATGIGIILAGFNPTNRPNAAIEFLNHNMNRDLEAQKAEMGKKANLLSALHAQYGNMAVATNMFTALKTKIVEDKLAEAAAQSGSQIQKGIALGELGKLERQRVALINQAGLRMTVTNALNSGDPSQGGQALQAAQMLDPALYKELASKYIPGVGMASKDVPVEDHREMITRNTLNKQLGLLEQFSKEHGSSLDPVIRARGRALAANVQDLYRTANRQGVFKESEKNFIESSIGSDPAQFFSSFRSIPGYHEARKFNEGRLNDLYSGYGIKPPAIQRSAPIIRGQ